MRDPLSDSEIENALTDLENWSFDGTRIAKEFKFANFKEAISFIVRLSFEAEKANHHPELSNVYNSVTVALTTHDAGNRVTKLDLDLARAIESFSWI
ncbi:MAG: 4a-hydroxytetrahydrobiopterin dehydratase [Rhodothermales bacterium]|nr:4a-hydroxytetrahydrobiopterin dehydratase [Rhodothermales bacterium]